MRILYQNIRMVTLTAFLLVGWGVIGWVQSATRLTGEVSIIPLERLPMQLGEWQAEDVELDDETVRVLKADSQINRIYRGTGGRQVAVHIAAWRVGNGSIAPHHPEICYPNAGWTLIDRRRSDVGSQANGALMEFIRFQRDGAGVVTAHWFESGEFRYTGSDGLAAQLYRLWGQKDRPATYKVLLQVHHSSIELAKPMLTEFGDLVSQAIGELQAGGLDEPSVLEGGETR